MLDVCIIYYLSFLSYDIYDKTILGLILDANDANFRWQVLFDNKFTCCVI